jgi:energy-coupling factor transporter ATP-binding protein EcfA2
VLARDPRLLLLDEPHAGLDAAGRAVLDAVVAAAPAEDRTVILASHELDRTRALARREVVLAGGVAHFGVGGPDVARPSDAKAEEEVRAG